MITTLTGPNTFTLRQELVKIRAEFENKYGESGIEIVDAETIEPQILPSLLQGATLFSTSRLVVMRNASKNKVVAEKLQDLLDTVSDDIHLVVVEDNPDKRTSFYKALKKETDFQEFLELDEHTLLKWVETTVKSEGGKISTSLSRLLVRYVGSDQIRLENEIKKLVAYQNEITEHLIDELVEKNPEETIFQLLENMLSGNTKKALEVLENLETAHEDPFQVVNMLIWQTHILAVVASAKDVLDNEIAKDFKINPFVVKKTRVVARRMNKAKLQSIVDSVASLDTTLKTSSVDPWRALETTLLRA